MTTSSSYQPRPKRKKTARACIHCQKAHVTCDSGRPCQRCIKKGCQDTCHDGLRKPAKYLIGTAADKSSSSPPILNPTAAIQVPQIPDPTPPTTNSISSSLSAHNASALAATTAPSAGSTNNTTTGPRGPPQPSDVDLFNYNFGSKAADLEYSALGSMLGTGSDSDMLSQSSLTPPEASPAALLTNLGIRQAQVYADSGADQRRPEDVYSSVTAPFPYTQGYHALIAYLRSRFDKKHLIHMARAMAAYRPSFIATTKTLKEEDLIFMEKCFQRTLLEFEKFIASSGTPTVVWRRTGQIAAVGKEFCILTEWPRERLINDQTFIVEVMDDKSVADYFDVFSRLAFGDSRGVTMTECTLLKPSGEKVPTACTWTVKRDVFDIPMMIIGNFLPILS